MVFGSEKDKEEFFNIIFRKYYNNVIYYALHYVYTYEEAQDVAEDVFTSVWQNLDSVDDIVLPYLLKITKNKCLNLLRKGKYHAEYLQSHRKAAEINILSLKYSSIDELYKKDALKILKLALDKMPPKTKEAFILSRFRHKSYSEIAEIQNVSVKNVEYRISWALKFLRRSLGLFTILVIGLLLFIL